MSQTKVKPATGKLGIFIVGNGAVATTFMTGVLMARKGLTKPIGAMTQYDKIRVGRGADKQYLHYKDIVPIASTKFNFYPLAGLTVWNNHVSVAGFSDNDTNIGFNLGGGFEYYITDNFKANIEGKYQWTDPNARGVISIGAAYVF